jgi:hypothetical protein
LKGEGDFSGTDVTGACSLPNGPGTTDSAVGLYAAATADGVVGSGVVQTDNTIGGTAVARGTLSPATAAMASIFRELGPAATSFLRT